MTRTELAALVGAMTEGPWEEWSGCVFDSDRNQLLRYSEAAVHIEAPGKCPTCSNAAGIVALRNHAEKLLAVCDAAEALLHPASCSLTAYGYPCDCELQELRAKLRDLEGV